MGNGCAGTSDLAGQAWWPGGTGNWPSGRTDAEYLPTPSTEGPGGLLPMETKSMLEMLAAVKAARTAKSQKNTTFLS